jgi:hypothetical protein
MAKKEAVPKVILLIFSPYHQKEPSQLSFYSEGKSTIKLKKKTLQPRLLKSQRLSVNYGEKSIKAQKTDSKNYIKRTRQQWPSKNKSTLPSMVK